MDIRRETRIEFNPDHLTSCRCMTVVPLNFNSPGFYLFLSLNFWTKLSLSNDGKYYQMYYLNQYNITVAYIFTR